MDNLSIKIILFKMESRIKELVCFRHDYLLYRAISTNSGNHINFSY